MTELKKILDNNVSDNPSLWLILEKYGQYQVKQFVHHLKYKIKNNNVQTIDLDEEVKKFFNN